MWERSILTYENKNSALKCKPAKGFLLIKIISLLLTALLQSKAADSVWSFYAMTIQSSSKKTNKFKMKCFWFSSQHAIKTLQTKIRFLIFKMLKWINISYSYSREEVFMTFQDKWVCHAPCSLLNWPNRYPSMVLEVKE